MQRTIWLFLFAVLTASVQAQSVGTCEPAEAEAYLDVGNVRAKVFNSGNLFWDKYYPYVYEIPKGSGKHSFRTASFWIAGFVEDSLRVAAPQYWLNDFWPGPLQATDPAANLCTESNRIFEITRSDISGYIGYDTASENLRAWPAHLGAPVVDGDGAPTNYNLAGGDRPSLLGDQSLWWVMHDGGAQDEANFTAPIGLEVRVTAFAFDAPGVVGNSTFFRYILQYKGAKPLVQAYIAFYVDSDLGSIPFK